MFRKKSASPKRTLEQDFAEAAASLGWTIVSVGPEGANVSFAGQQSAISFQNLRPQWEGTPPESRAALTRAFLEALSGPATPNEPKTLAEARNQLVLRVGPSDVGVGDDAESQCPKWVMVDGHLSAFLVLDSPQTVAYVLPRHLREWNATFEEAYAIGYENLKRRTDRSKAYAPIAELPQLKASVAGDSFDAARALMLGELLVPWPAGGALFSVPHRDALLYGPVSGPQTMVLLDALINMTQSLMQKGGRLISDQIYWFDGTAYHRIAIGRVGAKRSVVPPDALVRAIAGLPPL